MSRRNFIRSSVVMGGAWMVAGSIPVESIAGEVSRRLRKRILCRSFEGIYVERYHSSEHDPSLRRLGRKAKGKVAVKLSTGEPGGHNFLHLHLSKTW